MTATYLVVRATLANLRDRLAFDDWYQKEHLPDAVKAFGVRSAWRAWSQTDPAVHCAFYRFASLEDAAAATTGPEIQALIAAFDRCWGDKVTRTREVLTVAEERAEPG
jgi:hypothetical protein